MGEQTKASVKCKLKKTSGTKAVANYERDRAAEIAATGGFDQTFSKMQKGYYGQTQNGILR